MPKSRVGKPTHNGKKILQKFLYLDPDLDDFQNLVVTSLSEDTSLVKFSRRSDE